MFQKLFEYVKMHDYEGIDLFDGLNSKLFKNTPFYKSRFFRLCLLQFCKRSPIDFRKILIVPKGFNPKAGALFLLGNLDMFELTGNELYKKEAESLYSRLKEVAIKRERGIAWGYNFDWQARAFYVPVGTPNVVTSVYVGKALLRYYETFDDDEALFLAKQIAEFISAEMVLFEDGNHLCFGYIPGENAQVHNANLLAASYLSSVLKFCDSAGSREKILKAVNFSTSDIQEDGSWPYGTKPFHRWVDNFHTAFNIESLIDIRDNLNQETVNPLIERVVDYYIKTLFTTEGLPKYYNNKVYPLDVHVIAESVVVLNKIKNSGISCDWKRIDFLMDEIIGLAKNFQDKKGYFYYQKDKYFWNKIPYIRWGQAWMFFALANSLLSSSVKGNKFVKEC